MPYSSIQKPFPGRKSDFFVEGTRAWIPLEQKINYSRSAAGSTAQASPEVAPVTIPSASVSRQTPIAVTTSSLSTLPTPPAAQSYTPCAAARPATTAPTRTDGILHDCSDLIRPARRSFKHLVGLADTKRRLLRAAEDIRAGVDREPRNGILLFGEPGNGKTLFAEALAGELGILFLSVAFGDMASKWINETPEKLRGLFRTARRCAPCVLFIDEVDSFLKPRDGSGMSHSMDRDVVNTLLKEIVDLRNTRVVLVAATNYVEQLDRAAIRSGRFDFHIEVPAPDFQARRNLIWWNIVRCLGREVIDMPVIDQLARRWEGFSAARLAGLGPQLRDMQRDGEFDGPVTFDLAMRAMRIIQGQRGTLPEHVVPVEEIVMPEASRGMLTGLAERLGRMYDFTAMGGTLPCGILFYGPPGTGKTMAAMSLAKVSGFAFIPTTGTDLITRPNEWEKLVHRAKDLRPVIVFIDEADSILADRRHSNVSALTNRILATINGTGDRAPDIVYIAATNHPDVLDPAVLRGGRFAMQIQFAVPDEEEMFTWVKSRLNDLQMRRDFAVEMGTAELASQLLAGRPIADAQALVDEAFNLCVMRSLDGRKDDDCEPFLRCNDMQAAAQALRIAIAELPV